MGEAVDRLIALSGGSGKHDVIFYANRSTGEVVPKGKPGEPKKGYGKQTRRRALTAEEEQWLRDNPGKWLQVDEHGNKHGDPGYKKTKMPGREHLSKK